MRILTVRQPWASAIISGHKTVENRSTNVAGKYRGAVAVHSGVREDTGTDPGSLFAGDRSKFGHIIGVVDLVSVHRAEGNADGISADMIRESNQFALNGSCSPWAEANAYHMVLANPRPLVEPIPYKGALGLRRLDDDTTVRILAQIGEPT